MNKYLALVVIPVLASCTSSQVAQRPSREAAHESDRKLNEAFGTGLHGSIDQTSVATMDVTEDSTGVVGNFGRNQTRRYTGTVINTGRRGSQVVANQTHRTAGTVLDVTDDTVDLGNEQVTTYTDIVNNTSKRLMCTAGRTVGTGVEVYSNTVHSASTGFFCLFKRSVVPTRNYMVGSANDQYIIDGFPGSGWNRPYPQSPQYIMVTEAPVAPAMTSGKSVTLSK
jgi:hypothetical protein